jgi:hypothetical protein
MAGWNPPKTAAIEGVSIQYSVEAFSWITLTKAFSDELSELYAASAARSRK